MLDDIIEIIIEFILELFTALLFEKKMPLVWRIIFGVLLGVGGLALGGMLIALGMSGNKTWMVVLGAVTILAEMGIVIGVIRRRKKEKDILY